MPEIDSREDRLTNPKFKVRFQPDPPPDKEQLHRAWKLLQGYSHIPEDQVEAHVKAIVRVLQPLAAAVDRKLTSTAA